MRKGLFTSDFIVGLVIFIAALLIISPMWGSLNLQVDNQERTRDMQASALSATDTLIRTKGSPENWNNTFVKSIGLVEGEERILSANKSRYFFLYMISNYSDAKFRLGAGAYQLGAEMRDRNGNVVFYENVNFTNFTISADAREIAYAQRLVILKYNDTSQEFVNLRLAVWR
ncbi:MAG: hypothetical protein AABX01_06175 [Candidatus Micrarchaeota archaeon]